MKKLILFAIMLGCSVSAICQETFLGPSKDSVSNYYIMSIAHKKGGISEVFERVKPADGKLPAFRKQVNDDRARLKMDTTGFEKLGYYRRRIQYDCNRRAYRVREATYYDIYGHEIRTNDPDDENAKWWAIPAATMREVEFKKACK